MDYIECKDCVEKHDCERTYLGGCTDGEIAAQKAKIERLTRELDDTISMNEMYIKKVEESAKLQKQVNELKENQVIECHGMLKGCDMVQQAVKDTAKEIYGEIDDSDILVVETQEYGEIEVVPIERLKEIIKKKGVEVE